VRILHVAQPENGGVARYVGQLSAWQGAAGLQVAVATPARAELAARTPTAVERFDWPSVRAPWRGVGAESRRLREILTAWQPDLVHLHSAKAGLVGRLTVRGSRPTIFQPHGWSFLPPGPVRPVAAHWERLAARWTDAVLAVSEEEATLGRRHGILGPIEVVWSGIDRCHYRPPSVAERAAARADLGLHGPTAVCVGRVSTQKGQDRLPSIWSRVLRDAPDAELVIVGEGAATLAPTFATLPRVHLVEAVPDCRPLLWAADLALMPSRWEGLSLASLEAMSCGLPVVSFAVPGAAEAIARVCGAVVPQAEPDLFAAETADRLATRSLRDIEGAQAAARVERHFDLDRQLAQVTEVSVRYAGGITSTRTAPAGVAG
jgi:glycosyltransferase involved in cell wall biosynthesis